MLDGSSPSPAKRNIRLKPLADGLQIRYPHTSSRNFMSRNQEIFASRREAKWQFRRRLLLTASSILKNDPSEIAWRKVQDSLARRLQSQDVVLRRTAAAWKKYGSDPETVAKRIQEKFLNDTPEGSERHRLQDLSEGHPFACIIPEELRAEIYELTYGSSQSSISASK